MPTHALHHREIKGVVGVVAGIVDVMDQGRAILGARSVAAMARGAICIKGFLSVDSSSANFVSFIAVLFASPSFECRRVSHRSAMGALRLMLFMSNSGRQETVAINSNRQGAKHGLQESAHAAFTSNCSVIVLMAPPDLHRHCPWDDALPTGAGEEQLLRQIEIPMRRGLMARSAEPRDRNFCLFRWMRGRDLAD